MMFVALHWSFSGFICFGSIVLVNLSTVVFPFVVVGYVDAQSEPNFFNSIIGSSFV